MTVPAEANTDALKGGGRPLPKSARDFFEPRFGHDFSRVRIHTDAQAAEFARTIDARAFTIGRDIVFRAGEYALGTKDGRRLLAHELTHVVQQSQAGSNAIQRQSCEGRENVAERQGITHKKWSRDIEHLYEARGNYRAAAAIRECRCNVGACVRLLTEEEAWISYRQAREELSSDAGAVHGYTGSLLVTAPAPKVVTAPTPKAVPAPTPKVGPTQKLVKVRVPPALKPGLGPAPGAGVGAAAAAGALVVYLTFAIEDLIDYTTFKKKLNERGFIILEDPLAACIGLCHQRQEPSRRNDFDKFKQPRPEDWFAPKVPEEERARRRRCMVEEVEPKFGRYPCHSDFARTFSGIRREFRVINPRGEYVDFDAKQGEILYEVKTGYGWTLNPNLGPDMQNRRLRVIQDFQRQAREQLRIANQCGYELDWYFNSRRVAEYFQSLVVPEVKWKDFDCDRDSDHTW